MGTLNLQNGQEGYEELLANIRRLTVMVLDNLETGSKDRTLDQGQKRLLSSTGARLLRLWRGVLRGGGAPQGAEGLGTNGEMLAVPREGKEKAVDKRAASTPTALGRGV